MPRKTKQQTPVTAYPLVITYHLADGTEQSINAREVLPLSELGALVQTAAQNIVSDSYGYQPYLRRPVFWGCVLERYTDLDLSGGIEEISQLLEGSDLASQLRQALSPQQLEEAERCVDELVRDRRARTGADRLFDTVAELLKKNRTKLTKLLDPEALAKLAQQGQAQKEEVK